jgi:CheY-like chemotaxis protein
MTRSAVVLDDAPETRTMIAKSLRTAGFEVLEATNGEKALELAQSHAPDLIIANPLMAGMDSDEFALALSVDPVFAKTPVVFSAAAEHAREVRCLAQGCNVTHVLITPCGPDDIARLVAGILGTEQR